MSFWNLSDGSQAQQQETFDMGGGDFDPIPANTQVKSYCEEAKWDEYEGSRYINLKWEVIEGEHKGRKLFQKIKVCDTDGKKRDKAIRMLSAVDTNSGGGLMRLGQEPSDMDLQMNLCNKPMILLLQVWKIKDDSGELKQGNWVSAVSPMSRGIQQQQRTQIQPGMRDSDMPDF